MAKRGFYKGQGDSPALVRKPAKLSSVSWAQFQGIKAYRRRKEEGYHTYNNCGLKCEVCGGLAIYMWKAKGACRKHKDCLKVK